VRLGRVDPYHWNFILVPTPCPLHLFLKRSGTDELKDLGMQSQGFGMSLGLGDAVYTRGTNRRLRLLLRLSFHPQYRYAIVWYGERSPAPGQFRALGRLSTRAFANAGVEPAKEEV
jgi:hypothetical protein